MTRADCESVEAGAIPVRYPERLRKRDALVAQWRGAGFLNRSTQVRFLPRAQFHLDDGVPAVLVAERIGAGLLNRQRQVRLLPRTRRDMPRDATGVAVPLSMECRLVRSPYEALSAVVCRALDGSQSHGDRPGLQNPERGFNSFATCW